MINVPSNLPNFKALTPQWALQYLDKKPTYLAIRNDIIPRLFQGEVFCDIINKIRITRIVEVKKIDKEIKKLEEKNIDSLDDEEREAIQNTIDLLKKKKQTTFLDVLNEVFVSDVLSRVKNADGEYKKIKQLMGSLSNSIKAIDKEMEDIAEEVNKSIQENLILEAYEEEILMIMDDFVYQFCENVWWSISEGERKWFGQQAFDVFIRNHQEEIEQEKIDIKKLSKYLYTKKIL